MSDEFARIIERLSKNDTSLTTFKLNHRNIGDDGAKAIAVALCTNTSLTSLDLGHHNIGDDGAKAIAVALGTNTSLTYLYLYTNNIGDDGAKAIAVALGTNTSLTTLCLYENDIEVDGAKAILIALGINTSLKKIYFSNSRIGRIIRETFDDILDNNLLVDKVINKNTPPLGDGWSDAGVFDKLPNEILCKIAMLVWPTTQAIALAHTCSRWRDCMFATLTVMDRMDTTNPRVCMRNVFRALKTE